MFMNKLNNSLSVTFRLPIEKGVFPNISKIVKASLILKPGDALHFSNYRSVSVLPVLSKVLERIMYKRVFDFLHKNTLLLNKQFGFQVNTSVNQ